MYATTNHFSEHISIEEAAPKLIGYWLAHMEQSYGGITELTFLAPKQDSNGLRSSCVFICFNGAVVYCAAVCNPYFGSAIKIACQKNSNEEKWQLAITTENSELRIIASGVVACFCTQEEHSI